MALARLHEPEAARASLAKAQEILGKPHIDMTEDWGGGWGHWAVAEILHKEALELINAPHSTSKP